MGAGTHGLATQSTESRADTRVAIQLAVGLRGQAVDLTRRINLAVAAKAPIEPLMFSSAAMARSTTAVPVIRRDPATLPAALLRAANLSRGRDRRPYARDGRWPKRATGQLWLVLRPVAAGHIRDDAAATVPDAAHGGDRRRRSFRSIDPLTSASCLDHVRRCVLGRGRQRQERGAGLVFSETGWRRARAA
jgi:hypothetical protein